MDYNHLGIDEICSLLQDVISMEKQLYEIFSDGVKIRILAMNPAQMSDVFGRFYGLYRECSDKLNILEQTIRDEGVFFVDQKVLLENEIILFNSRYETVLNLYQAVCHAYEEYVINGSSGNSGKVPGLQWIQCVFYKIYHMQAGNEQLIDV